MSVFYGILLGVLQGITEFLPISSSGHLAIVQSLFKLDEVPLLFDVFLHLASLLAVIIFFWEKIWNLFCVLIRWIIRKPLTEKSLGGESVILKSEKVSRTTIIAILITTLITGVFGICSSKIIPDLPIKFVFVGFLITSILLVASSVFSKRKNVSDKGDYKNEGVSFKQAIIIGIAQGFGTLPGISRSGSTISGGIFSGVNRETAGEFSFIVSIPAILGAFLLEVKDIGKVNSTVGVMPVLAGCLAAFIAGYISLFLLMKIIKKGKLEYFALYLIPVGICGLIFM